MRQGESDKMTRILQMLNQPPNFQGSKVLLDILDQSLIHLSRPIQFLEAYVPHLDELRKVSCHAESGAFHLDLPQAESVLSLQLREFYSATVTSY